MKSMRPAVFLLLAVLIGSLSACSGSESLKDDALPPGVSLVTLPSSVVVAADRVQILAYSPDGKRVWSFSLPDSDSIVAQPVAAANSTTYVRGEKSLYAIAPDGNLSWSVRLDSTPSPIRGVVALGDSTVAITMADNQLVGYSHAGQSRWTYTLPEGDRLIAVPVTAPNSQVYLRGGKGLYAVDPNGNLTWHSDLQ